MNTESTTIATRHSTPSPPIPAADHAHHWLIESARGPQSIGRCKHCGAENEFNNSTQGAMWERGVVTEPGVATARRDRARARSEFTLSDEAT